MRDALTRTVQEQTESSLRHMDALDHKLLETLRATAKVLEIEDAPAEGGRVSCAKCHRSMRDSWNCD